MDFVPSKKILQSSSIKTLLLIPGAFASPVHICWSCHRCLMWSSAGRGRWKRVGWESSNTSQLAREVASDWAGIAWILQQVVYRRIGHLLRYVSTPINSALYQFAYFKERQQLAEVSVRWVISSWRAAEANAFFSLLFFCMAERTTNESDTLTLTTKRQLVDTRTKTKECCVSEQLHSSNLT